MMAAAITIAVCTHNRHQHLAPLVGALSSQTLARDSFEVLIVDNSTDQDSARSFYNQNKFPENVFTIFSSPPGLSRARNVATEKCRSRYLAFLDDDALPQPGWLDALLQGFLKNEKVAAVGGPIAPLWPKEQPLWLPREHLGLLTILDLGSADRFLASNEYVYGANMAFAVEPLRAVGGFAVEVGRSGSVSLLSGEETRVQDALRKAGYLVLFAANAKVSHRVHHDRLSRNWLRSRMAWQSVSDLLLEPSQFSSDWSIREIQRLATDKQMAGAVLALFARRDGPGLDSQLDLIRHLMGMLLVGKDFTDEELEEVFGGIADPIKQVEQQNAELRACKDAIIAGLERELARLRDVVCRVESAEKRAEEFQEELRAAKSSIQILLASTSWRVTHPLRWLKTMSSSHSRMMRVSVGENFLRKRVAIILGRLLYASYKSAWPL
jgi:glucosyl-dolichyl phosphate glucuronosyltransferase